MAANQKSLMDYRDDPITNWDIRALCVSQDQQDKAEKFNLLGKVERVCWGHWLVHCIEGYNKTTREVFLMDDGTFYCKCQWQRKIKKNCSHIKAVVIYEHLNEKELTKEDMYKILGVNNDCEFSQMVKEIFA